VVGVGLEHRPRRTLALRSNNTTHGGVGGGLLLVDGWRNTARICPSICRGGLRRGSGRTTYPAL
jgi:hypothetical protein